MTATHKVGEFTFDGRAVSGPADYMRSADYAACIASIKAGTNCTFQACCEHSPSLEIALLVTIQTSYAGWHGMQTFDRRYGL